MGRIFWTALKLGLTSFGGPTAHIGYFFDVYVKRLGWLGAERFTSLVALAQFLPGPASSQVGMSIGYIRGGMIGSLLSFVGFTLPSALLMLVFALMLPQMQDLAYFDALLHGLKLVALVIVLHAIIGMIKGLVRHRSQWLIIVGVAAVLLFWQSAALQLGLMLAAFMVGVLVYQPTEAPHDAKPIQQAVMNTDPQPAQTAHAKRFGVVCLALFGLLLVGLPVLASITGSRELALFDSFYRAGAMVFGGGHVVLPLLEQAFVATGRVSADVFLAGYGAAQAVPGPLFTFASFLGAVMGGVQGGLIATAAIFLPGFLLIIGVLPFWQAWQRYPWMSAGLLGVNAAVIGLLVAVWLGNIVPSAIMSVWDVPVILMLLWLLFIKKTSPLTVVAAGVILSLIMAMLIS